MSISVLKEKFAFATTPEARLGVIHQYAVSGSEDWYYYRGLLILQELYAVLASHPATDEGHLSRAPGPRETELLNDMTKHLSACKSVHDDVHRQLEARFKLLSYPVNNAESAEYIRQELGIRTGAFSNTPTPSSGAAVRPGAENMYPTQLDAALLEPRAVIESAKTSGARLNPLLIPAFDDDDCTSALLTIPQRRDELVRSVADMIRNNKSPDLSKLTMEQLEELRRLVPNVVEMEELEYVNLFLQKLSPAQEKEQAQDFDRIGRFVDTLDEHLILKRTVLSYQLLRHVVKRDFDQWQLFEKFYLADMEARGTTTHDGQAVNIPGLSSHFSDTDFSLLRQEFIMGALRQSGADADAKLRKLPRYSSELKNLHAQLILTSGSCYAGNEDALSWAKKVLGQEAIDGLTTEVELKFPYVTLDRQTGHAPQLLPSDAIRLTVRVKNINQITVRAYQLDLFQYWRHQKSCVFNGTDIKLDGLCPNWEKSFDMGHLGPLERCDMALELDDPAIFSGRGIWVMDVVGGRESCRAIVQKGRLRHLVKDTSAGHLFCILDESNVPVKAKLWIENQFYEADDKNNILVPYGSSTTENNVRALVVAEDDGFCEPITFTRKNESYDLKATFFVHPESLVANKQTKVTVTLNLSIYDQDVSLNLLEPLSLTVLAHNVRNVRSTFTKDNIPVPPTRNTPIELDFTVPSSLASLEFELRTRARTTSAEQPFQNLAVYDSLPVRTVMNSISSAYLSVLENGNYAIQILGKNGEPQPDTMVHLKLQHAMTEDFINAKLQTNHDGFAYLGKLSYVTSVCVTVPLEKKWDLLPDHTETSLPSTLYYPANTPFKLPYAAGLGRKCTLFQTSDSGAVLHDLTDKIQSTDETVEVQGLPVGKYEFYLVSSKGATAYGVRKIELTTLDASFQIATSPHWSDWLLSRHVFAQSTGSAIQNPLTLGNLAFTEHEEVVVELNNCNPAKTVALLSRSAFVPEAFVNPATRFLHTIPDPVRLDRDLNTYAIYLEGRKLSQEFEYVLNRARVEKWAGSTLPKPSMVMYPEMNKITTSSPRYLEDEEPHKSQTGVGRQLFACRYQQDLMGCRSAFDDGFRGVWADLDFLNHPCPTLAVTPDSHGRLVVPFSALGDGNLLHLVVLQGKEVLMKQVVLPVAIQEIKTLDLSHAGHDPKTAYVRSKSVAELRDPSDALELDMGQHEWEVIGTFEKMFDLFCNITQHSLDDFNFLKTWPSMSFEQKLKKHQEMVCHELNLWLKCKDVGFFNEHVKSFIKSKLHKTFMDFYLLEEDLTMYATDMCLYGTLSTLEKALLAKRVPELLPVTLKEFKELYQPPFESTIDLRFEAILAGSLLQSTAQCIDSDMYKTSYMQQQSEEEESNTMGLCVASEMMMPAAAGAGAPPMLQWQKKRSTNLVSELDETEEQDDDESQFQQEEDLRKELKLRQAKQPSYAFVKATCEWQEKGYFYRGVDETTPVNQFWIDYLQSTSGPFVSGNFIYANANLTESLAVLALMDLPFATNAKVKQETDLANNKLVIKPDTPCLVYYRALQAAQNPPPANPPILVGQGFFVKKDVVDDEIEMVDPTDLQPSVDYGWNVAISNISPTQCTAEVMLQVPLGSIPTATTAYIHSRTIQIRPYSTWRDVVGSFYFPKAGEYDHAPVTVSNASGLLGQTNPLHIIVKQKANLGDLLLSSATVSWSALTAPGSGVDDEAILDYLEHKADLRKIDLKLLEWRMQRPAFAKRVLHILRGRMFFSKDLWKYGLHHLFPDAIREFLLKEGQSLLDTCGRVIETPLVSNTIVNEPVKVLDYYSLISARVHPLGGNQIEILNKDLSDQYNGFLDYLCQVQCPSSQDLIMQVIYLVLQDRIGEAHQAFRRLQDDDAGDDIASSIQMDYLRAYLGTRVRADISDADMATLDLGPIRETVAKYKHVANARWQKMFSSLGAFLDEIDRPMVVAAAGGKQTTTTSPAQQEPAIAFEVDKAAGQLLLVYANVTEVQVRYYKMDIEVMFSMNPFMMSSINSSKHGSAFSVNYEWTKPTVVETIKLPTEANPLQEPSAAEDTFEVIGAGRLLPGSDKGHPVDIPTELLRQNCMIQVRTNTGLEQRKAYFSHTMIVHPVESHGVVRVASSSSSLDDGQTKRPLAGVYVKAYAKLRDGAIRFWKDGYTGLNGLFDYVSVTDGNALVARECADGPDVLESIVTERVERFSLLVSSPRHGALVEEVLPPRC